MEANNEKFHWFYIPYEILVNNQPYSAGNIELGFKNFKPTMKEGIWAKKVIIDGIYRDMLKGKIADPKVSKNQIDIKFGITKYIGHQAKSEYEQELLTTQP